ncbi:MAG: nucleotide exchange factor GrpE [Candidatus Ancillula trichonymphae]|jgi:molecular chaperone GrpE|nr:nucleotide exchange factor GrpE [Candidatus Ancillula trichonymphae]
MKNEAENENNDIVQEAEEIVSESCEDQNVEAKEVDQGEDGTSSGSSEHADLMDSLKRERADFRNYKNRAEQEMAKARTCGIQHVVKQLLPVLDEIGRAKDAGDLDDGSPFTSIATKLETVVSKLEVTKFGVKGEVFDPKLHEALTNRSAQDEENSLDGAVIIDQVVEPGYKYEDKIIRVAKVITVSA